MQLENTVINNSMNWWWLHAVYQECPDELFHASKNLGPVKSDRYFGLLCYIFVGAAKLSDEQVQQNDCDYKQERHIEESTKPPVMHG